MGSFRGLVLAGLSALALALALPAAPAGAVSIPPPELTCSYSGPPTNTVTFTIGTGEDTLTLRRTGDEIQLLSEYLYGVVRHKGKRKRIVWHSIFRPTPCNGVPTIHNTDTIDVVSNSDEDFDLDVSLEGGPLAPGATAEADGTSEIETRIESLAPGQRVTFVGGSANDWFRFGTKAGAQGVNLNAQDESRPDVDATMTLEPPSPAFQGDWPGALARTGPGDDKVTTDGGPEFDGPLTGAVIAMGGSGDDFLASSTDRFTGLNGGPGNDEIHGGPRYNVIRAGKGNDIVFGGAGRDFVELGKGHDFASTGPGKDGIAAFDHTRDRVECGSGRDYVARDRVDRVPGCELRQVRRVGIPIFTG